MSRRRRRSLGSSARARTGRRRRGTSPRRDPASGWLILNPYAAVPSLHVGLAFAIGIAVQATLRACWARALALMWGPLVTVSVVATGNHYVFDVAAGLVVTGLAYAAVRLSPRPPLLRPRGRVPSRPVPATGS